MIVLGQILLQKAIRLRAKALSLHLICAMGNLPFDIKYLQ